MTDLKFVGSAPHIRSKNSTIAWQMQVLIALIILSAWGVYVQGFSALYVLVVSTLSTVAVEVIFNLIRYKRFIFQEISSIVVGLTIGLSLPAGVSLYFVAVGAGVSILLIKLVCGGLGKNFVSEVAFGKLLVAVMLGSAFWTYCSTTGSQTMAELTHSGTMVNGTVLELLVGNTAGAIGETNILLIAVLGTCLCCTRAIDWKIPFFYLFAVGIGGLFVVDINLYLQFIASGGLVFVAFFVATDLGSAPNTAVGKMLFGIVCGVLNCIIWSFGNFMLAPYFAVLITELVFSAFSENFKPKFVGFYKEKK